MTKKKANILYDINEHIIEIYDQVEDETYDIEFILDYIKDKKINRILEPFCGHGRILIPLAESGYEVCGMDLSNNMIISLKKKVNRLNKDIQEKVDIIQADILNNKWPKNFDLIILACNCLYELATPEQQAKIIQNAYDSLNEGGFIFIDNDNMEGKLDKSWSEIGKEKKIFPNGTCHHAIEFKGSYKTSYVDQAKKIWRAERKVEIIYPDGRKEVKRLNQRKHPVSADEVKQWLTENNFKIIEIYSDLEQNKEFFKGAKRATFIAKKEKR